MTKSWQILLYRIKIVTMSCVVCTVSGRCPVDRDAVVMNGYDLEKFFIAVSCRLSTDCIQILPDLCRIALGRIGTDLVIFTMWKIEIGSESYGELENRDGFGWKRRNRDASWTVSDCCRDKLNVFTILATNHTILIRLLTNCSREWSYQGRQ